MDAKPDRSGQGRGRARTSPTTPTFVDGIGKLFQKYQIAGYEEPYEALKKQLAAYDDVRARRDRCRARAPTSASRPSCTRSRSSRSGVDMPVDELLSRAKRPFEEIQNQMQCAGAAGGEGEGLDRDRLPRRDPRAQEAAARRRRDPAPLPGAHQGARGDHPPTRRSSRCRSARHADRARRARPRARPIPAPNMRPPRLIGNTGEMGVFVLPLRIPGKDGEKKAVRRLHLRRRVLDADRARGTAGPRAAVRRRWSRRACRSRARCSPSTASTSRAGGSTPRPRLQPYEPLDGQLITLQHRLHARGARVPRSGPPAAARSRATRRTRVLREDVVLSEAMATQEVAALHVPGAGPGDRPTSSATTGCSRSARRRAEARAPVRPQEVQRLRARAGRHSRRPARTGGPRGLRPVLTQKSER